MRKFIISGIITAVLSATLLAGCTPGNNTAGATVSGAAAGGLLAGALFHGHGQVAGILAGTVIGGIVGNQIGQYMDRQDEMNMRSAIVSTPVGQQATWTNSKTKTTYTVQPIRNYHSKRGRYCREYRTTAVIAGKRQQIYGHACRMPDGTWKAVA